MIEITSKDNQYLKLARSLQQKKRRAESGLFVAEGLRLAEEAERAAACRTALFSDRALTEPRAQKLAQKLEAQGAACYQVSSVLLDSLSDTEHPQGVLALCRQPDCPPPTTGEWFAYCDNVSDPGNLGAILRSAWAAGCSGLLLSPDSADVWNSKVVRASMGAVFHLPLWRAGSEEEAAALLEDLGALPLITAMDGRDVRCCGQLLQRRHCWILGSEAVGVSQFWRGRAETAVSLPMTGGAESLNVSCAAAVLFYQSFFQRSVLPR